MEKVTDLKRLLEFAKTSEDPRILRSAKILEADLIEQVAYGFFGKQCYIIAMPKNPAEWLITVQFRSHKNKTFNVVPIEDGYKFAEAIDPNTQTMF